MDKELMATVSFSVNSPHDISPFYEKMVDVSTKKAERTKGVIPSAARPCSGKLSTRCFPSPDYSGFGFLGIRFCTLYGLNQIVRKQRNYVVLLSLFKLNVK
jgi:hypothetical protein